MDHKPVLHAPAGFTVPVVDLISLRRSITETAGPGAASEILFRLGRQLGERAAREGLRRGDAPAAILEQGMAQLGDLGLGHARLRTVDLRPEERHARIAGNVRSNEPLWRSAHPNGEGTGEACEMTVGFLTGLAATATGLDVVCTPLQCGGMCAGEGCGFEIHPGHREAGHTGHPAPAGSARFFLRSMGTSLADADVSLDDLIDDNLDAIILIDRDNVIRFWNRGAERTFLYAREEAVGTPVGFLVPSDLLASDELGWIRRRIEAGETVQNHVTRRVRKDGVELWVSLNRAILHDSNGRAVGSMATLRDITRQRQTETELTRSRGLAMVGELAAKVAHEIKNPLAGIYAAVQILEREFEESDPKRDILGSVGIEIRRLDETVQDLLRFAKPAQPRPRPTDLRSFVGDLRESLQHNPEMCRHRVEIEIPEGLIVEFDARLVAQVFTNLFLNACQAMEESGELTVSAHTLDGEVVVTFADTGPGIHGVTTESIFEPFVTTKARGTGLGLPIARRNIEAHGGKLVARNREHGGAEFIVCIPLRAMV
ncbi:MAG: PAS domain S-box protein [Planctomycetota bacterium]